MDHKAEPGKLVGLPMGIVGPVDLGRILREAAAVDDAIAQMELRKEAGGVKVPKTSQLLDQTVEMNHINLLDPADRKTLLQFLTTVRAQAPVLHISFSADPSPLFTQKLMEWLRKEIHPLVLLTVGMQPNIGAGCVVRTTNKYFDFSLRQHLTAQADTLMASLREVPVA